MDDETAKIKGFIVEEFMPDISVDELESDFDLLNGGVVDSLGLPPDAGATTSGHRQPELEVNPA